MVAAIERWIMMFKKMRKYLKFLYHLKEGQKSSNSNKKEYYGMEQNIIHKKIELNLENVKKLLGNSDDIIIRHFSFGVKQQTDAFVCFIDGMADKEFINEYVIKPLLVNIHIIHQNVKQVESRDVLTSIKKYVYSTVEMKEGTTFDEVLDGVLSGNSVLFIDGYDTVLIISAKGVQTRNIEEPNTEVVVRGSREGFTETLRVNTTLLRRIIKNPKLTFESLVLGKQTHTDVCIAYIDGIADEKIIKEVKSRLKRIDTDSILESGYIEQFIDDNPFSPFSTIRNSERPDKVAAKLLEGRVAILCNGTPFVLTVPHLFIETLQVPEDYYARPYLGSFLRLLRLLAFIISMTAPCLYVALETFHQEMVPPVLLITAAASREGIPFPAFVETMIMIIILEMLRESGVRLPRQVGQAVSIVGALVIGEAAVRAGIISAPMVIIGALTGVTTFIVPALLEPLIFSRFLLLFLSAAFGFFGVCLGIIIIIGHMCSLESFGVPYMAPLAPTVVKDLKDTFIRFPLWLMKSRPNSISSRNSKSQGLSTMPKKPDKKRGED